MSKLKLDDFLCSTQGEHEYNVEIYGMNDGENDDSES